MIEHGVVLPVTRQAEMLGLSRSSVYYEAVAVTEFDLALMRRIDELHLERPSLGSSDAALVFCSVMDMWSAGGMSER